MTWAMLRMALLNSIADGKCTSDLGGELTTSGFTRVVADGLEELLAESTTR